MKRILAVLIPMFALAIVVGLVILTQRGMFSRAETLPIEPAPEPATA